MNDKTKNKTCLACQRGTDQTPLVSLEYLDSVFWICPQHLPLLIHGPARLIGKLPGAENLAPAEEHGHGGKE